MGSPPRCDPSWSGTDDNRAARISRIAVLEHLVWLGFCRVAQALCHIYGSLSVRANHWRDVWVVVGLSPQYCRRHWRRLTNGWSGRAARLCWAKEGVDDVHKSATLASRTARRSTSSLDAIL